MELMVCLEYTNKLSIMVNLWNYPQMIFAIIIPSIILWSCCYFHIIQAIHYLNYLRKGNLNHWSCFYWLNMEISAVKILECAYNSILFLTSLLVWDWNNLSFQAKLTQYFIQTSSYYLILTFDTNTDSYFSYFLLS